MPIEIRELMINAKVDSSGATAGAKDGTNPEELNSCKKDIAKDAVEESMGQVKDMMNNKNER